MFPLDSGTYLVESFWSQETNEIKQNNIRVLIINKFKLKGHIKASMPGSFFPSRLSSIAPPPVET